MKLPEICITINWYSCPELSHLL